MRLTDWNIASFAIVVWMIFSGTESLRIAWINAHLLGGRSFCVINIHCSWNWKKLLELRPLFRPILKFEVKNGRKIFIWRHPKCLHLPINNLKIVNDSELSFNAKLSKVISRLEWRWPPARLDAILKF